MATDIDVGLLAEHAVAPAAAAATEPARAATFETFTAQGPPGRSAAALRRIGHPLAAYGSPLALLLAWQIAGWLGALPAATAASPIDVGRAAVHLWHVGAPSTLGEDLRVSLTRALAGLALGVGV